MGTLHGKVKRSSKKNPCPVCRNDHGCMLRDDGLIICLRCHGEVAGFRHLGEARDGMGGIYRAIGDSRDWREYGQTTAKSYPKKGKAKKLEEKKPSEYFMKYFAERIERAPSKQAAGIARFAEQLGLSPESSQATGEVWDTVWISYRVVNGEHVWRPDPDHPGFLLTPMFDGYGKPIGAAFRDEDGKKTRLEGGREGLFHRAIGPELSGPIIGPIVEGPTDVKAAIEMGLFGVIGRPSVSVGAEHLANLLRVNNVPADKPIVVVIEDDRKSLEELPKLERENGTWADDWPGRTGTEIFVAKLRELGVKNPVVLVQNPGGTKDLRAWYAAQQNNPYAANLPSEALGKIYVSALMRNRITSLTVLESAPARPATEEEIEAALLPPEPSASKPKKSRKRAPWPIDAPTASVPTWLFRVLGVGIPQEEIGEVLESLGYGAHPFGSQTCWNPWGGMFRVREGVNRDGQPRQNAGCLQHRKSRCGRCSGDKCCAGCWAFRRLEILGKHAWLASQNITVGEGMLYQIRLTGTAKAQKRARDRIRKQAQAEAIKKGLPLPGGDVIRTANGDRIMTSTVRVGDMEPLSFRQYADRLKDTLASLPHNPGGKRSSVAPCWGTWYGLTRSEERYLEYVGQPKTVAEVMETAREMELPSCEKSATGCWLYVREYARMSEQQESEFLQRTLRSTSYGRRSTDTVRGGKPGFDFHQFDADFDLDDWPDEPPRRWAG